MKKTLISMSIILLSVLIVAPVVLAASTSYAFNLQGPNVSTAAATIPGTPIKAGDYIRLVGAGTFDPSTGTASGGGAFTHFNADGTVFARGTWTVVSFVSFNSFGGPNPGTQDGLLKVIVTLVSAEATFTLMMQVQSGASPEGVTIWDPTGSVPLFGIVDVGQTSFH